MIWLPHWSETAVFAGTTARLLPPGLAFMFFMETMALEPAAHRMRPVALMLPAVCPDVPLPFSRVALAFSGHSGSCDARVHSSAVVRLELEFPRNVSTMHGVSI